MLAPPAQAHIDKLEVKDKFEIKATRKMISRKKGLTAERRAELMRQSLAKGELRKGA